MTCGHEFGSTLRRERERRNISLKAIAQQTKISAGLLAALERGDCSRWPAGIYSRAWIRDYAHAVGLDPDETAADFGRCFAGVAFPGQAEKKPAEAEEASLRLSLDERPQARLRHASRRAALLAVELTLTLLAATTLSSMELVGFWPATTAILVILHAIGAVSGDGSAAGWCLRLLKDPRTADDRRHSGESAVPEAA